MFTRILVVLALLIAAAVFVAALGFFNAQRQHTAFVREHGK